MTAVKGSLLVTAEGMELAHVADVSRDQAVGDFHRMKTEAERQHDRFYALIDLFSHQFSYGEFTVRILIISSLYFLLIILKYLLESLSLSFRLFSKS